MRAKWWWAGVLIGFAISISVAFLIFMLTCVAIIVCQSGSIGSGDWAGWANALFTLLAFGAAGLAVFYSHKTYESQKLTSDRDHMDGAFSRLSSDANSLTLAPIISRQIMEYNNDPDLESWSLDEDGDYASDWLNKYSKMAMAIHRMLVVAKSQHPRVHGYARTLIPTYLDPNVIIEIYSCEILNDGWKTYGYQLQSIYDDRIVRPELVADMVIIYRAGLNLWHSLWMSMREMSCFLLKDSNGVLASNYPNVFSGSEALEWLHGEMLRLDKIHDSMSP